MVEWRFRIIGSITTEKELLGTSIPPEWQMWEEAYFKRVSETLADSNHTATLINDGCDNGDSEQLNCTKTCGSAEYMFKSPQNLWNCMTLSTVAMKVVPEPTNDTVNRESESEMKDKFHFESLRDFRYPFGKVRKCLWQSCSDSKYGACTPGLVDYQCDLINQFTVEKFGTVLSTSYCRNADPGIDSDLVGQGVLIAYIIQHFLVLFFGLSFGLTCRWTRTNVWGRVGVIWSKGSSSASDTRSQKAHGLPKWLTRIRSQFPSAIISTLVDLQEAQALFTATISVAAIIAFHGYLGLASIVSISSYVLNNEIALGVMIIGMSPLFLLQLSLDASGNASMYTLIFVFLNWLLILLKWILQKAQGASKFEAHLKDLSSVPACGDNPGAMSYCMNYGITTGLGYTKQSFILGHVLIALLAVYWTLRYLVALGSDSVVYYSRDTGSLWERTKPGAIRLAQSLDSFFVFEILVALMVVLSVVATTLGLTDLFVLHQKLHILYTPQGGLPWSFGQLTAVAVWFPVVFKFLYYCGVEDGVQARIDKDEYVVSRRETAISEFQDSKEPTSEGDRLIEPVSASETTSGLER
ncbi:hypothetical protein FOXG_14680 [Fusarium oxysporum f. sp. lycopersici 4287]|uniref:Uncharacterized protein n=2 Tax=Fusarium oxysporum TaxID=5507 RepID=A0A0J9VZM9_FUSO4|nr:hypothetical protein FOXG_14680 [Fusarium oxysporum f. sp. lycopersici 4287]EXK35813.1 hypothetical protein FOMG_09015 [Fusarium oxysporum f. sp. melonis 26406]KNB16238.1 hypothetical protein FOXG_14680 [Fusarium oxysporum f. sp. lycopersici 4287]